MCERPREWMIDGLRVEVRCKKCRQCRGSRIWDYVGRCMAEADSCGPDNVRFVTLTYGNDDRMGAVPNEFAAVSVVKRDIQNWMKRIRAKGHRVRYLCAAEFGPLNARVHFHALLFFYPLAKRAVAKDRLPAIQLDKRHFGGDEFWPHGMTYWRSYDAQAAWYCCKYLLKAQSVDNPRVRSERTRQYDAAKFEWSTMSKKPPLGAQFFERRAERFVEQGLSPQDLIYSFPEVKDRATGKPRRFYMGKGSRSADLFLRHFVDAWRARYPDRAFPASVLVEEWLDRNEPRPATVEAQADRVGGKDRPKALSVAQVAEHVPGRPLRLGRKGKGLSADQRQHNSRSREYRSRVRW